MVVREDRHTASASASDHRPRLPGVIGIGSPTVAGAPPIACLAVSAASTAWATGSVITDGSGRPPRTASSTALRSGTKTGLASLPALAATSVGSPDTARERGPLTGGARRVVDDRHDGSGVESLLADVTEHPGETVDRTERCAADDDGDRRAPKRVASQRVAFLDLERSALVVPVEVCTDVGHHCGVGALQRRHRRVDARERRADQPRRRRMPSSRW